MFPGEYFNLTIFLSVLCSPVAVYLDRGFSFHFFLNFLLYICGIVPGKYFIIVYIFNQPFYSFIHLIGIAHAIYITRDIKEEEKEKPIFFTY